MNYAKNKQLIVAAAAAIGGLATYKALAYVLGSGGVQYDESLSNESTYSTHGEDAEDNSKLKVDHVGLINDGATCYLNSLIQTLFQLPVFRKAVFAMKSDTKMAFALQRLFYNLMVR